MIKGACVGEGAYGKVYLATAISGRTSNKSYALKRNIMEIEVDFAGNLREPDILLRLKDHPNIVQLEQVIYGEPFSTGKLSPTRSGYKDDSLHFVLEKADLDLRTFIHSSMKLQDMKSLIVDMLLGLEYMHTNKILHRDIKPGNLLLFFNSEDRNLPPKLKLCDFGLSKFYTFQEPQTPRMVTVWYRAPEIVMKDPNYNEKVDVWSVGCVFYEMITCKAFIETRCYQDDEEKENKEALETILKQLPKRLPSSETKKIKEKYGVRLPRGRRKGLQKELFPTPTDRKDFEKSVGSVKEFTTLLTNLLQFDPNKRPTIREILENHLFDDFKEQIQESRELYLYKPCFTPEELEINVNHCQERKWAINLAFYFYNKNRSQGLLWYKHRIIFQAIDLFDRYLDYINQGDRTPLQTSSSKKQKLAEEVQAQLRFIICIYIAIKYFATLETPISYIDISADLFSIEGSQEFAQAFERELLEKVFKYYVYRPTVFECADQFDELLNEKDIMNLLMAYGQCEKREHVPLPDLYQELRKFVYLE